MYHENKMYIIPNNGAKATSESKIGIFPRKHTSMRIMNTHALCINNVSTRFKFSVGHFLLNNLGQIAYLIADATSSSVGEAISKDICAQRSSHGFDRTKSDLPVEARYAMYPDRKKDNVNKFHAH